MKLQKWNNDQSIPNSMPLLDKYVELHRKQQPFKDVTMLLIQHQLGNHVPQANALLELGLDPENLFWLDIPYTSTTVVREYLIKNFDIPLKNFSISSYQILERYAHYQRKRTQDMLRYFFNNPPRHLIVLDDGAYFIEAMSMFKQKLPNVSIVEQTTRGFIKIRNNEALKILCC
jgi:hypothetical protein